MDKAFGVVIFARKIQAGLANCPLLGTLHTRQAIGKTTLVKASEKQILYASVHSLIPFLRIICRLWFIKNRLQNFRCKEQPKLCSSAKTALRQFGLFDLSWLALQHNRRISVHRGLAWSIQLQTPIHERSTRGQRRQRIE